MKSIFTAGWAIICVVVLFFGHSYWNERTAVKANPEKKETNSVIATNSNQDFAEFLAMASNWPNLAKEQFQQSLKKNKPFKILLAGSSTLGTSEKGIAKDIATKLIEAYGNDKVKISIHTYNLNSKEFIDADKQDELASEKAGLILIEPFLLNDNGIVTIQDSLTHLTTIIDAIKKKNPNAAFILQPSYPLFGAIHYPVQVEGLQEYAKQNQLAYLNHWTSWPDYKKDELKNYLLADQSGPNEKGIAIWEKAILDYLISK